MQWNTYQTEAYLCLLLSQQQLTISYSTQVLFLPKGCWCLIGVIRDTLWAWWYCLQLPCSLDELLITSQTEAADLCRRIDVLNEGCDTVFRFMVQNRFSTWGNRWSLFYIDRCPYVLMFWPLSKDYLQAHQLIYLKFHPSNSIYPSIRA